MLSKKLLDVRLSFYENSMEPEISYYIGKNKLLLINKVSNEEFCFFISY